MEALLTTYILNYLSLIKCAAGALFAENNRHSNTDISQQLFIVIFVRLPGRIGPKIIRM